MILEGDCREHMAQMDAASVDLIVADPPYGETSLVWDRWPDGWVAAARRVLKPSGSMWVFGSMRMFMAQHQDFAGWHFVQDVIWEKQNGTSSFADRFRRVHEVMAHFHLEGASWSSVYRNPIYSDDATARTVRRKQRPQHWGEIGEHRFTSEDGGPRLMRSVIYHRNEHGRAINPTQKPVGLVGCLIEYSCPPGGLVLDPFFGSGTTAIAAERYGVRCIAIEADHEQAAAAGNRITNSTLSLRTANDE